MISDFLCFSLRLCFIHVLLLRTADTSETTMDLCSMKLDAKLKHFHRSQLESIERSAWDVWQCFRLKKNIAISDLNVASSQNHKKKHKKVLPIENCTICIKLSFSKRQKQRNFVSIELRFLCSSLAISCSISISMNRFMFAMNECKSHKAPLLIRFYVIFLIQLRMNRDNRNEKMLNWLWLFFSVVYLPIHDHAQQTHFLIRRSSFQGESRACLTNDDDVRVTVMLLLVFASTC